MANKIISYLEMCGREGTSLQRGMNFGLGSDHSVVLMSVRPNAPYRDRLEDEGTTLIYEGHDEPRSDAVPRPKAVDQPERTPYGTLTQNGRLLFSRTKTRGESHNILNNASRGVESVTTSDGKNERL